MVECPEYGLKAGMIEGSFIYFQHTISQCDYNCCEIVDDGIAAYVPSVAMTILMITADKSYSVMAAPATSQIPGCGTLPASM